jgi:hypothetical protein
MTLWVCRNCRQVIMTEKELEVKWNCRICNTEEAFYKFAILNIPSMTFVAC